MGAIAEELVAEIAKNGGSVADVFTLFDLK